ncbi:MAG TPA: UDP-glucose--hexose-1-phosphate uridylyltransferase [Virgibacillus sp.]|nr:UDP-glucose--hexose-1-phosphate uridylyltransferase [Virgibacillus sp.]
MIYAQIAGLIQQAIDHHLIERADEVYARNQILGLLNLVSYPEQVTEQADDTIPNLVEKIITYAIDAEIIADVFDDKEILSANIMNCLIARPSIINETFQRKYEQSPMDATTYFYELSKNSNYIQMNRIRKNIHFKSETIYGDMDITINMSKPEKDPEQIKRERAIKQEINYPKCPLCMENEGYVGRTGYPARANHRIIQVPLGGENWYFQYSPYVYYNEHSILFAEKHRDMKIDQEAFARLLTFVELYPHYFIGSNADLPIVGGSILSHDHYQAGYYEFAMTRAATDFTFELERYTHVAASVLEWPLAAIRLQSKDKAQLVAAAEHILGIWKNYDDEQAHIQAFTGDTPHNTITPIARMNGDLLELDLVLRNNRTNKQNPTGIFHPKRDVHHIKQENIGLIEVMGLAVLPARLKTELAEIKQFLLQEKDDVAPYHQDWANHMKEIYPDQLTEKQVDMIIEKELGKKFTRVLEDADVFKDKDASKRFINTLNK